MALFPASTRSVAAMCGVSVSAVVQWFGKSDTLGTSPRDVSLRRLLEKHGHRGPLFTVATEKGRRTHLYDREVCLALLEHYAFDASRPSPLASDNFRRLAAGESPRVIVDNADGFMSIGVIYFVRCAATNLVKVGFTTNIKTRLHALQSTASAELTLLRTKPGTMRDEQNAHRSFADRRVRGEWFRLSPEDVAAA